MQIETRTTLPAEGIGREQLRAALREAQREDVDWRGGRLQGLVYAVGEDVAAVAEEAYLEFFHTNPLSPRVFPSLKRFEDEIIGMVCGLLHAPQPIGTVTTGGTESNLLAVLAARELARATRPNVRKPTMVVPTSAHPSFNKAGHLFDIAVVRTPVQDDMRADPDALRAAVDEDTILIVGSAPGYTHGVVDPIPELASIAAERGIPCHVDGCVGGMFLPFVEQLGDGVPLWDFRVPGVTSISADLHKHGYTAKGASTLLLRTPELLEHQRFEFNDWPNGRYSTATIAGTRAGGAVAAAWAVMNYLGTEGYKRIVANTMEVTRALIDGISEIPGLEVWGRPVMNKFGYGSRALDIGAVADGMEARGWAIGRQKTPPGINMHVFPVHGPIVASYLRDLDEVTRMVVRGEIEGSGKEAAYN